MEYLGRLGLVPRKSKKDRDASPQKKRYGEESRHFRTSLKTDLTRAIETDVTCASSGAISLTARPQHTQAGLVAGFPRSSARSIVDIARLPLPADDCTTTTTTTTTTAAFFPRSSSGQDAFIDIEYFAYEQHVQAQARARANHNNANGNYFGGRHAWKTLIFWKRRRRTTTASSLSPASDAGLGGGSEFLASASSTPFHHQQAAAFQTPTITRRSSSRHQQVVARCNSPLYSNDCDSTISIRAWYEPMMRSGKLAGIQNQEYCNRSPYVALGARRQSRLASPGPLYLV